MSLLSPRKSFVSSTLARLISLQKTILSRTISKMSFDRYADVHKDTHGPGDARPTAHQIVEDDDLVGKLSDKVMFITGTSSGIV